MLQKQIISNGSFSLDHYFLCTYLPYSSGKDNLSRSLLRFKSRLQIDLQAWIECCSLELNSILSENFILLRALHNNETVPTLSGMDHLGVELAEKNRCHFRPQWLTKIHPTRPLKSLRKTDRLMELNEVYQFRPNEAAHDQHYLILDDILTTGTTAFAIARAIVDVEKDARITIFTLAKVDYDAQLNETLMFYNEMYHWENRNGWEVNEEELKYNQLQSLKNKILKDEF
jgi:predicted amidophosphoribosyltransferase